MVAGAEGCRVGPGNIDHYTGAQSDFVCGESSELVRVGGTIWSGVGFIVNFTEHKGTIGMSNFSRICINGKRTTGKFQRANLWAYHPYGTIVTMPGSAPILPDLALSASGS